jgi:nucleotide-binding universal stress UspA family protein
MFKLESILFPVEFSQRDDAAAPFVLSMALRYHARIVLLHVLQPPPPVFAEMSGIYPEAYDVNGARENMSRDLQKFAATQFPKVEVECMVELGNPAAVIQEYACSHGIDLIAMPTHGYGVFRRTLLGSVTAKVLHDSGLPVWTSAHAPEPSHRAHPKPRVIVCALDMKPESRRTLEIAFDLAQTVGAKLELLTVPSETVDPDTAVHHLQDLLEQVADTGTVDIQKMPADEPQDGSGSVAEAVRHLALHKRADLVVIGRGAIQTRLGHLYANCYGIIRESPCPVLSV